jgi:hypothetical protein
LWILGPIVDQALKRMSSPCPPVVWKIVTRHFKRRIDILVGDKINSRLDWLGVRVFIPL